MRALLIKGLLYLFALLPLRTAHSIATVLGKIIARWHKLRINQVTRTNIRLCFPHLSNEDQEILIKQSLIETCKTFIEMGALWLWTPEKVLKLVREVSGEAELQKAYQRGKGVLVLTPHLGSWEIIGLYTCLHYSSTGLYRPPKLVNLHDLIHTARERTGGRYVPADKSGVRALYQALQQKQFAGLLPDQVPSAGMGIFVPFFGIPAYSLVLPSRLAHKSGASVFFGYAERLPRGLGFHIHYLPAPAEIAAKNQEVAVRKLNQGIEQCIQHCPTQYQWSYKRFKRRPDGEASVY
ncbi:lysophospholipid acyltransferase family protein [Candidatus Parabeggiatoa sp. HSG14]|uniref:lysophospholipid acyltransferase family protein n=1 Tax=Candidatus Parabeggiatoa sp. HSG14 TaxID=3055593 RepID=UPI0025A8CA7B|nr:lysophospholipid acyltransferase family protein [Thiotrichales bacterium HSG14]